MKRFWLIFLVLILIALSSWLVYRWSQPEMISPTKPDNETKIGNLTEDETNLNYPEIQKIILDKTALFFDDADSSAPKLKIPVIDDNTKTQLEAARQTLTSPFSTKSLAELNLYLANLKLAVNSLTPGNSGLTQTQINNFQQVVTDAQTNLLPNNPLPEAGDSVLPAPTPIQLDKFGVPRLIEGINRD